MDRALLGEISSAVRAVFCKEESSRIFLRFVFDGEISDDDRDSASCVGAEVIADFPAPYMIKESIQRLDAPAPVTTPPGWLLAYQRELPND